MDLNKSLRSNIRNGVFTASEAQRFTNARVDSVSLQQIMEGGFLFYDLDTEKETKKMKQKNEFDMEKKYKAEAYDKGYRGLDIQLYADRQMVGVYVATESTSRFHVAQDYIQAAKDDRPETLVAITLGDSSYIRNETSFGEYLDKRLNSLHIHEISSDMDSSLPMVERRVIVVYSSDYHPAARWKRKIESSGSYAPTRKMIKGKERASSSSEKDKALATSAVFTSLFNTESTSLMEGFAYKEFTESLDTIGEEAFDEGPALEVSAHTLPEVVTKDIWIPALDYDHDVPSSSSQSCFDIAIGPHSIPGHTFPGLDYSPSSVDIKVLTVATFRELQFDSILGTGAFGVVSKIRERSLKSVMHAASVHASDVAELKELASEDSNYDPVKLLALKITLQHQALLTPDGKEQNPSIDVRGAIGEYLIGEFVNRMFLTVDPITGKALTPNVTRTSFGFVCKNLPPSSGEWGKLYAKNKESRQTSSHVLKWNPDTRLVGNWSKERQTIVYATSELADKGDLWSAKESSDEYMTSPEMIESLMFQGLFTLAAFREYGFLHQDIKPANLGIMSNPQDVRAIYYIENSTGDAQAVDPLMTQRRDSSDPKLLLKFLDYGNYDMTYNEKHNGRKVHYYPGTRGTATYTAPEGFILIPFANREQGQMERWPESDNVYMTHSVYSTASDVWSYGISIVSIIMGGNTLNNTHDLPEYWTKEKRDLWLHMGQVMDMVNPDMPGYKLMKRPWDIIKAGYNTSASTIEEGGATTFSQFTILFELIEMVGFPWADTFQKEKSNSEAVDLFLNSGAYPFVEIIHEHQDAFNYAPKGGWLWKNDKILAAMSSVSGLRLLQLMLAWLPSARADPHRILLGAVSSGRRGAGRYFSKMLISDERVEELDLNPEVQVTKFGWKKGSLALESVMVVGGHMSGDHTRATDTFGMTQGSEEFVEVSKGLPLWKITKIPKSMVKEIESKEHLAQLFGKVHPDNSTKIQDTTVPVDSMSKLNISDEGKQTSKEPSMIHKWM
jgi:serine/threonine protein kinase